MENKKPHFQIVLERLVAIFVISIATISVAAMLARFAPAPYNTMVAYGIVLLVGILFYFFWLRRDNKDKYLAETIGYKVFETIFCIFMVLFFLAHPDIKIIVIEPILRVPALSTIAHYFIIAGASFQAIRNAYVLAQKYRNRARDREENIN